jgi:hypothetical protein
MVRTQEVRVSGKPTRLPSTGWLGRTESFASVPFSAARDLCSTGGACVPRGGAKVAGVAKTASPRLPARASEDFEVGHWLAIEQPSCAFSKAVDRIGSRGAVLRLPVEKANVWALPALSTPLKTPSSGSCKSRACRARTVHRALGLGRSRQAPGQGWALRTCRFPEVCRRLASQGSANPSAYRNTLWDTLTRNL